MVNKGLDLLFQELGYEYDREREVYFKENKANSFVLVAEPQYDYFKVILHTRRTNSVDEWDLSYVQKFYVKNSAGTREKVIIAESNAYEMLGGKK